MLSPRQQYFFEAQLTLTKVTPKGLKYGLYLKAESKDWFCKVSLFFFIWPYGCPWNFDPNIKDMDCRVVHIYIVAYGSIYISMYIWSSSWSNLFSFIPYMMTVEAVPRFDEMSNVLFQIKLFFDIISSHLVFFLLCLWYVIWVSVCESNVFKLLLWKKPK